MNAGRVDGDGHPRRNRIAVAALLVMSVGLGAILAAQSIQTARRHRETAERTLRDYAGFAAFVLASHVSRELGEAASQTRALWTLSHLPPPPVAAACPGGNSFFEEHDDGVLHFAGAPLPGSEVAFLNDSLLRQGGALRLLQDAHWRLRFVRAPAGPVDGYFIFRSGGLAGFSVCFRDAGPPSPAPSLFRHVMLTERALPGALVGDTPADSMYSITITAGHGRLLYTSPGARSSPYHGIALVGPDLFGDLSLRLDLRPELADRLIVGGVPVSPVPLAIGLLGLSATLVVVVLFQLRREYRLMATRSEFVANVSHELRTPLSQILFFVELLKLGRLRSDTERSRALDIVDHETRRLIRLVENVLQFSRGPSRRATPPEPMLLDAPVRETIEAFRPLAAARGVTLHAEIPAGASVRADRSSLRQILLNLLDNAVKYGPRGQVVRVEAHATAGRTRLAVEDQGPGIPREERDRIWEGYYRLRRDSGTTITGSGIGLSVVRSLAEELRGRAWVEETGTGGARFMVELPSGGDALT